MSQALFDHANVSAEFAEREAADLRVELRQKEEAICALMELGYKRERALIGFYQRLQKFHQVSRYEVAHAAECLLKDEESVKKVIENFRAKWGQHPMRNGKIITTD